MRYPPEQKEDTRRRIVDAASRAFRRHGVEGASVSEIMADAGLTVGGFYRHFESKDELFQEAMEKAVGEILELMQSRRRHASGAESSGEPWLRRAAAAYLSPEHREMRSAGCPLPGLTAEIGRRDESVRRTFEESLCAVVDEIALRVDSESSAPAQERAWGFLSTLVGSLLLARGVADEALAEQILAAGRKTAIREPAPEETSSSEKTPNPEEKR